MDKPRERLSKGTDTSPAHKQTNDAVSITWPLRFKHEHPHNITHERELVNPDCSGSFTFGNANLLAEVFHFGTKLVVYRFLLEY